ncbi:MAG: NADH-quinone oxidoreductase subunit J [Actinomycetota bacterium]|nr:NADH-quinone oxidoreductase subunit J [Actinomycetota bacterium]
MIPVLAQAPAPVPAAAASPAELVVFLLVGAVSLGSAVSVVVLRNAVHAALMLVVNFFTIAVLYAVLEAQFLATVQIIVYAGAIMVLFLFVIMLLGVDRQDDPRQADRIRGQKPAAVLLGVLLFAALATGVAAPYLSPRSACPSPAPAPGAAADTALPCAGLADANTPGNVQGVGALLFGRYVWPFEVTSVLLVIAAIGAMVLGRRREDPRELVDRPPAAPAVTPVPTAEPAPPEGPAVEQEVR